MQDYFFHKEGTQNGGNRYATVLTYLNDVEEGGETVGGSCLSWCSYLHGPTARVCAEAPMTVQPAGVPVAV